MAGRGRILVGRLLRGLLRRRLTRQRCASRIRCALGLCRGRLTRLRFWRSAGLLGLLCSRSSLAGLRSGCVPFRGASLRLLLRGNLSSLRLPSDLRPARPKAIAAVAGTGCWRARSGATAAKGFSRFSPEKLRPPPARPARRLTTAVPEIRYGPLLRSPQTKSGRDRNQRVPPPPRASPTRCALLSSPVEQTHETDPGQSPAPALAPARPALVVPRLSMALLRAELHPILTILAAPLDAPRPPNCA